MLKIISILILPFFLYADMIDDKILNLLGKKEYRIHNNLIGILFKKRENFLIGDQIRYIPLLTKLKKNGLLHIAFEKPVDFTVHFHTKSDPRKSLKILNDTLKNLGYYYFFTKEMNYDGKEELNWSISLKTEYAIDPLVFAKELLKQECLVTDIQRVSDKEWRYSVDSDNGKLLDTVFIDSNEKVVLQKPLKPYLLTINEGKVLKIISRKLNKWYPYIVFYDEDLNILQIIKKNRMYKGLQVKIPENTKYIKVSDLFNLINIKRGLSVTVKTM